MKKLKQLYEELESRKDFQIVRKNFDGGMGYFRSGSCKGMTVIWSYGGGWEHVSIDGKKWACQVKCVSSFSHLFPPSLFVGIKGVQYET